MKNAYDKCVVNTLNFEKIHGNGKVVKEILAKIENNINVPFPLFSEQNIVSTEKKLSTDLAYFSSNYDVNAFISLNIQGVKLLLNAPELTYPEIYYQEKFDTFREDYVASIKSYVKQFANFSGISLNEGKLDKDVNDVVNLEKAIADAVNTDTKDESNIATVSELNGKNDFINISLFISSSAKFADSFILMGNLDFPITIQYPTKLKKLQQFLSDNQVNHSVIYNMIYCKLLRSLKNLFPQKPAESVADEWLRQGYGLTQKGVFPRLPSYNRHPSEISTESDASEHCARRQKSYYQYAVERIFLDEVLPTKEIKKGFRHKISLILNKVLNGFRVS